MRPQTELLRWYQTVKRDLPWRQTRDPYRILVSEVMCQQTQVDRVIPFYQRFIDAFPTAKDLAHAELEQVHRLWKGLGYPSRAERLQKACWTVLYERAGVWPDTVDTLQELPGIGPYTAGAVACFAFARPVPLVDTNVARVYARRDQLPLPLHKKELWTHSASQVEADNPIDYNNALMELGALICTARNPNCGLCPWSQRCLSNGQATVHEATSNPLKVASKKVKYGVDITDKSKLRQHIVLALIWEEDKYLVTQRPLNVHMGGYWELPGGKREKGEDDRIALAREIEEELGVELLAARPFVKWNHEYEDRYLTFHCYRCRVFHPERAQALASDRLQWVTPKEFVTLEFPPANQPVLQRFRRYHRIKEQ